jgi:GNAT superfamily N-acetyltransferase
MVENAFFSVIDKENIGLTGAFSVNPSSCENSEFYREYLQYTALSDLHAGKNTTHVFIDEDANRIMGFVSLRASAIISQGEGGSMTGSPALEVSVLAVDKDYEGQKVGTALIDYVIYQSKELREQYMGLQYIILAADRKAVGFYERMGFESIENRWNQMPKENWSVECAPMFFDLDFEKDYMISYASNDDDDEDE